MLPRIFGDGNGALSTASADAHGSAGVPLVPAVRDHGCRRRHPLRGLAFRPIRGHPQDRLRRVIVDNVGAATMSRPIAVLVRTFTDPEELPQADHWASEQTVTQRGRYLAKFHFISLPKLSVHHYWYSLARINYANIRSDRIGFTLRTSPGPALIRYGIEFGPTDLMVSKPADGFFQTALGAASHGGLHFPVDDFNALSETVLGCDPRTVGNIYKPSSAAMARLQRLHAAILRLAEEAPERLAHHEAAHGLEQTLIEAMMDCLSAGAAKEDRVSQRNHAAIMRRFRRVIEQRGDEPLYLPELCREIGTSPRMLDMCCQEHLRTPPKHYLLLRRMRLVRRALLFATPAKTTVTDIVMRYGFWQLGHFSVAYRVFFGESPSATLAREI